ncbi:MAG: response regulator [Phycisphaerales bacterium]|nr:response regulator [Phycisphaerales bacterium]
MTAEQTSMVPGRILIADDEHLVAAGLASCVKSLGCAVVGPAADGQEAIQLAERECPDLALLDIRMPGADGIDAAAILWRESDIPCIIVTAYSDEANVTRAQHSGVFGFLLKPVTVDSLRTAIAIAWSRANDARALRNRVGQLETTLSNRKIIEQAKWRLVETQGMSEPEAHAWLQRTSRNGRRTLVDVANEVIRQALKAPARAL